MNRIKQLRAASYMRWHSADPKNGDMPKDDIPVLCKVGERDYIVLKHNKCGWWQRLSNGSWCGYFEYQILGWRTIWEMA